MVILKVSTRARKPNPTDADKNPPRTDLSFGQSGHMISSFALNDLATASSRFDGLVSSLLGANIPSLSQAPR